MSFKHAILHPLSSTLHPVRATKRILGLQAPELPPAPGVPNQNDAANASLAQQERLRMRRGMMANIYGGAAAGAPVTGKTQLGT